SRIPPEVEEVPMRKVQVLVMVLLSWFLMGAKVDCGNIPWVPSSPTTGTLMPAKPFCYTDPPLVCAVYCAGVHQPSFTDPCGNVEAGPRTQKFEDDMQAGFLSLMVAGREICPDSLFGGTITPCQDGIPSVEWPNQDHEFCTPPPAGCPL